MKSLCLLGIALIIFNCTYAQTDSVFSFVEQMPEFPGGTKLMMSFLSQNITYPDYERDHDIQGKVLLKFVVDTDGSLKNIQVTKRVSPGIDSEAIRVIKLLPKFTPGKQEGKAVKVYFNMPITFKLTEPPVQPSTTPKINPDSDSVYQFAEQNPVFPGGDAELTKLLAQNIHYPVDAKDNNITGKVLVRFIVNEDGHISDVKIIRSVYPSLDTEAVRVIKLLPNFGPGYMQGKPVKTWFNLPIVFKLSDLDKEVKDGSFIYTFAEVEPHFPGGGDAFKKFIAENIHYPEDARNQNIEGYVILKFVVNEDGALSDVQVSKSLYPSLDAEAIRVVGLLPKFVPGKQYGKHVKVWFNTPIVFHLN